MRYLKDIDDSRFKISIYQWNNKYVIKIESGMYEQTYKIDQYEITDTNEIELGMDEEFREKVAERFAAMHEHFNDSLKRNDILF